MERTASIMRMCPGLSHVVTFSPLQGLHPDLKAFLPLLLRVPVLGLSPARSRRQSLQQKDAHPPRVRQTPRRLNPGVLPSRTYQEQP